MNPISLKAYGVLMAHVRHFQADERDAVLRRLDFEPSEWVEYERRGEQTLIEKMERGEPTGEFMGAFASTKKRLAAEKPAVDDLPMDEPQKEKDGPPRTMRLRDMDPVEYLDMMSSRAGAPAASPAASPAVGPLIPGVDAGAPAPAPVAAFDAKGFKPPPERVAAAPQEPELLSPEQLRAQRKAALAKFERTQVSPSSSAFPVQKSAPVNVQVAPSAPAHQPPSSPDAALEPKVDKKADTDAPPRTQLASSEDLAYQGADLPALTVLDFANLCAEFSAAPPAKHDDVRKKYRVSTESQRLALLDVWRMRLVEEPELLAEWKQAYDSATRHWQAIYRGT